MLFRSRLYARDGLESWLNAEQDLRRLINNSAQDAVSIRNLSAMARAMGLGTENIFSNLGHDGHLAPLTGPFAGQALHPLRPPPAQRVDAAGVPLGNESTLAAKPPDPPLRRARVVPVFPSDDSLRRGNE